MSPSEYQPTGGYCSLSACELVLFTKCINENQSAWTGVGRWVAQGRLRLLCKELADLADAAEDAEDPELAEYHRARARDLRLRAAAMRAR
jgi:hypothetical protein